MSRFMKFAAVMLLLFMYSHLMALSAVLETMNAATHARRLWQWQADCQYSGGQWHSENQTCVKVRSVAR